VVKFTSSCEKALFSNPIWMYAPGMGKQFGGVPVMILATWSLASCNLASRHTAGAAPETRQEISAGMKQLYMDASMAAPQSPAQQKIILRMAQKASSGKEMLLTMRASVGVFPLKGEQNVENQVRALVTVKMIKLGTLDQLIEYATEYPVDPVSARKFIERMFELGNRNPDAATWYRIKVAALHLHLGDLERLAQAKGDQLAGR
jgi:hypothetical protein